MTGRRVEVGINMKKSTKKVISTKRNSGKSKSFKSVTSDLYIYIGGQGGGHGNYIRW